jgi:hypothetical protein
MDKNTIKKYLLETFITETKNTIKDTKDVPGINVTAKANKKSGVENKAGLKAIAKDVKDYEKSSTKADTNAGDMAKNKFNYANDNQKTYHDEMEIMNGQEMIQYDRIPDKDFKDRAIEAIEGSSRMGNNPEWANVVEKGWGGDPEFGKNLVKKIKASEKKRNEQTPTIHLQGKDIEADRKDYGNKPYAFENKTSNKRLVEINVGGVNYDNVLASELKADGVNLNKIIPYVLEIGDNVQSDSSGKIHITDTSTGRKKIYANIDQFLIGIRYKQVKVENNNKQTIKETMKRLKFKKDFNGVGNALKLIPESYRTDMKVFEMTDGNESYKIRWEGSLTEGAAVVLTASDKKMINEDVQRMKALFNYKSQDTLGLVKGKDRVDENASFSDIYAKTKKLLGETEDIEGQTADSEGEWDDAGITQAADAKKHVQGSVSTEKGTQAPAPKNGEWDKVKKKAPEATKDIKK